MNAIWTGLDTLPMDIRSGLRYTKESGSSASGRTCGSSVPDESLGESSVTTSNNVGIELQHSLRQAFTATQIVYDALGGGYRTTHQEVAAFLYLAGHPDAGQTDITEVLGVAQQSISRWLNEWSTHRAGHGFLSIERDPDHLAKVIITWTPKGIRLLESVRAALKGSHGLS